MQRSTAPASAGHVIQYIRDGIATTRPELVRLTGLSRTAVTQRVAALLDLGLVVEHQGVESTGGRPPTRLRLDADAGIVLAADFDVHRCRMALSRLDGTVISEVAADKEIALGPDRIHAIDIAQHGAATGSSTCWRWSRPRCRSVRPKMARPPRSRSMIWRWWQATSPAVRSPRSRHLGCRPAGRTPCGSRCTAAPGPSASTLSG